MTKTLMQYYKSNSKIEILGNYRIGDIRSNYADLTKIKNKLGFKPKVIFEEGIRRFSIWTYGQETAKDSYDESINEMKKRNLYR